MNQQQVEEATKRRQAAMEASDTAFEAKQASAAEQPAAETKKRNKATKIYNALRVSKQAIVERDRDGRAYVTVESAAAVFVRR